MTTLLPLLENLVGAQSVVVCAGAWWICVLTRHVLSKLADRGPDYIEKYTAHKVTMAGLKHAKAESTPKQSDAVLVFPSRRCGELPAQIEKKAA